MMLRNRDIAGGGEGEYQSKEGIPNNSCFSQLWEFYSVSYCQVCFFFSLSGLHKCFSVTG